MRLHSRGVPFNVSQPVLGRLTRVAVGDPEARPRHILFGDATALEAFRDCVGYGAALCPGTIDGTVLTLPAVGSVPELDYLDEGDVVYLRPDGSVNVLFRKSSASNSILVTERCNSACLMCSQPPKDIDDSYRAALIMRLVDLIDPSTAGLTLTGGEPTLLEDAFIEIVARFAHRLPNTSLHVLTNGRRFSDASYACQLARLNHPDLVLGIPLYSDVDSIHDHLVGVSGAFNETVDGLYNLAEQGVRLELRIVLTQQTSERLPQWAEFIYRNFTFVEHVALMGLEPVGLARRNRSSLYGEPDAYVTPLETATLALALRGVRVSIYNHQLCALPRTLWPYAAASISDWKATYPDECAPCGVRRFCGGYFESAVAQHTAHPRPLNALSPEAEAFMRNLRPGSQDPA